MAFSNKIERVMRDAEEGNRATASDRDAVHRYAGTIGSSAKEDRQGSGLFIHL